MKKEEVGDSKPANEEKQLSSKEQMMRKQILLDKTETPVSETR